ncbi:hypothetical protein ACF0H5_009120 [Mactra antiquata]
MLPLVFLLLAANHLVVVNLLTCGSTNSMGTEFVFGVPLTVIDPTLIAIHISTLGLAHVNVDAPYLSIHDSYTVNRHLIVNMSHTIEDKVSGSTGKLIQVTSDVPVTVVVLPHSGNDAAEGFLALPVSALSTKYIVSSFQPYGNGKSEFLVVPTENGTVVNFTKYDQNSRLIDQRVQLDSKYDVYQYQSSSDLSSTVITSNKPVAVIAGASSVKIPSNTGDYNFIVEQLVPTDYWGYTYIVPNLYPRQGYYLRVYSNESQGSIDTYVNGQTTSNINIQQHRFTELHSTNSRPSVIQSSMPISVMQYGDDNDRFAGDPFMSAVQAVSQFQSRYDFITDFIPFSNEIWDVTLAVTALTSDIPDILLDNVPRFNSAVKFTVPAPYNNYTVVLFNMTHTSYGQEHTLVHKYGHVFGASIYSFAGTAVAYGYPLGFNLTNNSVACSVPDIKTTTTILPTTTRRENATTGIKQCFSCHDIPHLKYCDHVTTCKTDEICFVERYNNIYGELLYRSGCMRSEICSPINGVAECLQCCDGDYCNMNGCGDYGVQNMFSRGPYCFDCNHVGEADECHSVQVCPQDQICMIEKYVWGPNDFNYAMGCVHSNVCRESKRSINEASDHQVRRHVPACTHCCSSDFCNRNCTNTDYHAVIG